MKKEVEVIFEDDDFFNAMMEWGHLRYHFDSLKDI